MRYAIGVVLIFAIGCGSSQETIKETITVPADTASSWVEGRYVPVQHNPDCDSIEVFKQLLDRTAGELTATVEQYELSINASAESYANALRTQDSLKQRVDHFRLKLLTKVVNPEHEISIPQDHLEADAEVRRERDEAQAEVKVLKDNQITTWHDIKTAFYGALVGIVLLIVGVAAFKAGLIKLPFIS